jgi:hypothetical protein
METDPDPDAKPQKKLLRRRAPTAAKPSPLQALLPRFLLTWLSMGAVVGFWIWRAETLYAPPPERPGGWTEAVNAEGLSFSFKLASTVASDAQPLSYTFKIDNVSDEALVVLGQDFWKPRLLLFDENGAPLADGGEVKSTASTPRLDWLTRLPPGGNLICTDFVPFGMGADEQLHLNHFGDIYTVRPRWHQLRLVFDAGKNLTQALGEDGTPVDPAKTLNGRLWQGRAQTAPLPVFFVGDWTTESTLRELGLCVLLMLIAGAIAEAIQRRRAAKRLAPHTPPS